jgi:hypothetical protein
MALGVVKRGQESAFLRGVARIFDFCGTLRTPVDLPEPETESAKIAAVWAAVGRDLSHVLAAYEGK